MTYTYLTPNPTPILSHLNKTLKIKKKEDKSSAKNKLLAWFNNIIIST